MKITLVLSPLRKIPVAIPAAHMSGSQCHWWSAVGIHSAADCERKGTHSALCSREWLTWGQNHVLQTPLSFKPSSPRKDASNLTQPDLIMAQVRGARTAFGIWHAFSSVRYSIQCNPKYHSPNSIPSFSLIGKKHLRLSPPSLSLNLSHACNTIKKKREICESRRNSSSSLPCVATCILLEKLW